MTGSVCVREEIVTLAGWPTDVVRVDHCSSSSSSSSSSSASSSLRTAHTLLVFVPGNPGCIGWYIKNLAELVERLGPGFAARGVSYAGHSANASLTQVETKCGERDVSIPWTLDGQIQHKCEFLDYVLTEFRGPNNHEKMPGKPVQDKPRFLFLSHSIGSHMVERVCVLRPDILQRTHGVLHLMPFTRMDPASRWDKAKLDFAAAHPAALIGIGKCGMQCLRWLPMSMLDHIAKGAMDDAKDRDLAIRLLRQPTYARNFFELGTEEIRDVPEIVDVPALKWIGSHCPMAILYAGNDQWAPMFHMKELQELQQKGIIPFNISFTYMEELRHDYVSYTHMVPTVIDWCFQSIQNILLTKNSTANMRSRL